MSRIISRTAAGSRRRAALAFGGVLAAAALAFGSATPALAAQNIDPNVQGSITVHKFEEPTTPTDLPNNGTPVDTSGLTAIPGITFSVQQVDVDLSDSAVWQTLETITVADAKTNLKPTVFTPQVTDASGVATFSALPLGLYLVTETSVGSNKVAIQGAPFLVTIPLALNNDWIYDVNVYPKNTVTALTKDVVDANAYVLGDAISFPLTAQVPSLPVATPLTAFGITDALDARLQYTDATVTVAGLTLVPADYTILATGQNISLTFTPAGLAKLRTVQGNEVTFTINTTIRSIGNGLIENTAQVFINDPATTFDSNTVSTSWGALTVTKHASTDRTLVLSGAEFELYATDALGARVGGPLRNAAVGGTIFTTGPAGTFTVEGLKAGAYELVETKAPRGYRLNSEPIDVTVVQGSVATALPVAVSNTQIPAFALPLTGSTGVALFTGLGVLLAGSGVALALVRKRRSAQS